MMISHVFPPFISHSNCQTFAFYNVMRVPRYPALGELLSRVQIVIEIRAMAPHSTMSYS